MLTMLATALLGGQVFADVTETAVDNCEKTVDRYYYGKYSDSESVSGGNVTVKKEPTGEVPTNAFVYGGRTEAADASNNMVTMQGGTISNIYGGYGKTGASNNTVVLRGGTVQSIRGGNGDSGMFSNNVVIVTGGTITSFIWGGYGVSGSASNNRVHLVGKGASNVFIADGQGITSSYEYTGGENGLSLAGVSAGYINTTSTGTTTGNSIDVYGSGISFTGGMANMQKLTFNITNDQVVTESQAAAVSNKSALNLTGVELLIKDLDVKEWTPGKTITLVQSTQAIKGASDELTVGKEVEIKRGEVVTATATLKLGEDQKSLILTNIQGKNVPEPATSSLSLLALAGLCVRRRRK